MNSLYYYCFAFLLMCATATAQTDSTAYKKRVLESTEIDLLFSYYGQDGSNAAVTGGQGTEELTDATSSLVVSIPMNADAVLTLDVGVSAYSSASSSNVNPFDGGINNPAGPFNASSGASQSDVLAHFNPAYRHSADNRNSIWQVNAYVAAEYDYFSIGFGGAYTQLFNEKNTELGFKANVFLDQWNPQYPIELRNGFFDDRIRGNGTYDPTFEAFSEEGRNSYSFSISLSQILGKRWQAAIFADLVMQRGLLSTPFQRVYFGDTEPFFIEDFQLADDVERLPDTRFKIPLGLRMNYFLSDRLLLRSYYRFYYDDWGVTAHTASLEIPIKVSDAFSVYPSYRYYRQQAANYFYPKEAALSSLDYYTADYDLSQFHAHQYGMGFRYKDIFTRAKILGFGFKSVDLRLNKYDRSDGLDSFIISLGTTFVGE